MFKRLFCKHDYGFVRNIYGNEINILNARSIWRCRHLSCGKVKLSPTLYDIGEMSDGYHTFNELYHHRALLFSVICNSHPNIAWKSLKHHDGTMYDNMFIVGINTPEGQATYHYDINPYWNMFKVKELEQAPQWDGHTAAQAVERIKSLSNYIR